MGWDGWSGETRVIRDNCVTSKRRTVVDATSRRLLNLTSHTNSIIFILHMAVKCRNDCNDAHHSSHCREDGILISSHPEISNGVFLWRHCTGQPPQQRLSRAYFLTRSYTTVH